MATKDAIGRTERAEPPPSSPPAIVILADRNLDLIPDSTIYNGAMIQSRLKQGEYGDLGAQLTMFSRMIESDAHLWSIVQTRRLTVKKAERDLLTPEGLEDDEKAQTAVAYCAELLPRIVGFDDAIPALIDGPIKGFSGLEIIWDGSVPVALTDTPESGWRWRSGVGLQVRKETGEWLEVPPDKFLIHSPRGNSAILVRRGALRACVKWWLIKNISTRDWAAFVELFGIPFRKLTYPDAMSPDDPVLTTIVSALRDFGASGIAAIRKGFDLELVGAGATAGRGFTPHEGIVRWCDAQLSKAILGQTLTVDTAQATGTYSAAKVHNEVRLELAQADAEAIGEAITRDLLTPLVGYGLGWDYPVPRFVLKVEDPLDEKVRAEVLQIAVKLGLPIAEATIREELRIREPEEDEELLSAPKPPNPFQGTTEGDDSEDEGGDGSGSGRDAFRRRRGSRELLAADDALGEVPLALEALALLSDREWREAESETIPEAVLRMLRANPELGEDPEELLRRLSTWYVNHEPTELADHIERAMNGAVVNAGLETDEEDREEREREERENAAVES